MWIENFQMFKLTLEGRRSRDQIANIHWIIEKAREFQKNIYFCFIDYAKAFDYVIQRIGAFELWCWRRLLRIPWAARRSNQSILKEISPEYSWEGLMLKLKLQHFGHLMRRADSLEKTLMLSKIEGRRRRGWRGWMASLAQWTWVWISSRSWWWTGKPGMLQSMGSQRVRHDWVTKLNWTEHNKLWKILPEMAISDHLTCLLRNLYACQEATIRTGYGTIDWFQIGKGVSQGYILSPCLFNFYAEYIMQNAGLDEAQPEIKIAGRNINNLRYARDTTSALGQKVKRN